MSKVQEPGSNAHKNSPTKSIFSRCFNRNPQVEAPPAESVVNRRSANNQESNNRMLELRNEKAISKDAGLYDEAMTCLCFTCDKCLKAMENTDKMNSKNAEKPEDEVDLVTSYF